MPPVDFELSDDQSALRDAAGALTENLSSSARVRKTAEGERHLDDELWGAMSEQGWLSVERPQEQGGLGLGMVEVVVLAEQLGSHLAPVPFAGTVLALGALSAAVSSGRVDPHAPIGESDVAGWIDRLSTGESTGAVAWSRQPSAVRAREEARNGAWVLSGRSDPVIYGPSADVEVVFADASEGSALFAVALPADRRPASQPAMDRTRSLAWLDLDDVQALRIGGDEACEELLDRAATVTSAEMLGAAQSALEMTVEYSKNRVQFGRPIGSFQAVKHRCADMLVDVEGMRSSAYYAAWAVGASDPQSRTAASAAKIWCSDASERVMASALQVHGGIGFTWEHDLHLFLKRSQLDQTSYGDAAFHRERLARILRPRAEAGLPVL